jgi:hypothetical protein
MMIVSMSASEEVAERALLGMDWIREQVTSFCPMASEVLDALIDSRLEEDPEATCFAIAAMGKCLEKQDPDAALYLLLKADDAREALEKEGRECPRGRPAGPRPPEVGTTASALAICKTKREKLAACFESVLQEHLKEKAQREGAQPETTPPPPPRRRPTWIFDGTKIVGSKEPTEELPQMGDPAELELPMKVLVLSDNK